MTQDTPTTKKRGQPARARSGANGGRGTAYLVGAAAVVGLGAGLLASFGRKFAVQAVSAAQGDWFEALKVEHKATLAIFDKIEATSSEQTTKRRILLMQLKHALSKHAFQEENVIYPSIRDAGDEAAADALDKEHAHVKTYLFELGRMAKDDPRWLPRVVEFRSEIEAHVAKEENEIFPALHLRLGEETNAQLTAQMIKEGLKLA